MRFVLAPPQARTRASRCRSGHLCAASAAVFLSTCLAVLSSPQTQPVAPVRPVVDVYFGTSVSDPYRYMENADDPEVRAWMKAQADYTASVLGRIPGRKALLERLWELASAGDAELHPRQPIVRLPNGKVFYHKRAAGDDVFKFYVRNTIDGAERLLVDPEAFRKTTGKPHGIIYATPSGDGRHLAYGVAPGGSEDAPLRIMETATGGEYGDDWHMAGFKQTKPNTWKDFIACAEYLVRERYTSPAYLAASGGSAGGILIGRAITERPDLFAAANPFVGLLDMLRSETTANGVPNIPEFGTVKDPDEFKALYEMSTLVHITDKETYPAVLLTHGINDPRVEPWHSAKVAARLQAATASGKPVLLRLDYETGHGAGTTKRQRLEEYADILAFMLWQVGVKDFQPKPDAR